MDLVPSWPVHSQPGEWVTLPKHVKQIDSLPFAAISTEN